MFGEGEVGEVCSPTKAAMGRHFKTKEERIKIARNRRRYMNRIRHVQQKNTRKREEVILYQIWAKSLPEPWRSIAFTELHEKGTLL